MFNNKRAHVSIQFANTCLPSGTFQVEYACTGVLRTPCLHICKKQVFQQVSLSLFDNIVVLMGVPLTKEVRGVRKNKIVAVPLGIV